MDVKIYCKIKNISRIKAWYKQMISQIVSVNAKPVEQDIKIQELKVSQSQETQSTVQSQPQVQQKEQVKVKQDDEAVVYETAQKSSNTEEVLTAKSTESDETNSDMDINGDGLITVYEMMEYLKSQLKGTDSEESGKVSFVDASNAVNAFNKYRANS